jgi:DNA processing protein
MTLKSVPGIGNLRFRRLVDHFDSPLKVLDASVSELTCVEGITPRLARAIRHQKTPDWVETELERVHRHQYTLITLHDPGYPPLLLEIPDPPPILYIYGQLDPETAGISVVGSRHASSYGLTTTHRLCKRLAAFGMVVVSGMARGIDTAAHNGALAGNGRTVAVLGSGLACIYPAENRNLFHRIAENGAVITEFALNDKPEPRHFPMRNRIISGLSLGTVVVEAAKRSGSLITARLAAEQGRDVFAVPGNIHAPTADGPHHLIQQGAKLVRTVEDIIEEIRPQWSAGDIGCKQNLNPGQDRPILKNSGPLDLTPSEKTVFAALEAYEVHIDELTQRLASDTATISSLLMQLELKGMVCRHPGNHYARHIDYADMDAPDETGRSVDKGRGRN